MEISSEIKKDDIKGLQIWSAKEVNDLVHVGGLVRSRLGSWHTKIFPYSQSESDQDTVSVFCLPSYEYLTKHKKRPTKELPLGTVCWRSLLSRYVDEDEFLESTPEEKLNEMFEARDEVGAFGESLACYVHAVDIYKIMLSNMHPSDWAKVTLNKVERVMTLIGDFSMLYYSNAKWFHFVPSYNRVPAGKYEEHLELLLQRGHTFDINRFGLTDFSNTKQLEPWLWSPYRNRRVFNFTGLYEHPFSVAVEKDFRELADEFMSIIDEEKSQGGNGTSPTTEGRNVFLGGVTSREKEYEVSRVLASIINNLVLVSILKVLKESFFFPNVRARNDPSFEQFQMLFLTVQDFEGVRRLASLGKSCISELYRQEKKSDEFIRLLFESTRALSVLSANLSVLDWSVEGLNGLNQKAWLAGTVNTVE